MICPSLIRLPIFYVIPKSIFFAAHTIYTDQERFDLPPLLLKGQFRYEIRNFFYHFNAKNEWILSYPLIVLILRCWN